jgi:hypothetical protein
VRGSRPWSQPLSATNAASGVGAGAAMLNGVVQPEGTSIAYFQYGTSAGYGASTPRQSLGSSLLPQPVSALLGGLTPATTYHFRIVDEQFGIIYGADQTFTTGSVPVIPPTPPIVAPTPPVVSYASPSYSRWRRGNHLAPITKARPPVGTVFSFTLNEQATVSLAFTQQVGGRKVGGKCVTQTKANQRKRSCKRSVTRAAMSFNGHQGLNKVAFQGRVSRSRTLGLGTYTLVITAINAAGQRSSPKQLTFTIVNSSSVFPAAPSARRAGHCPGETGPRTSFLASALGGPPSLNQRVPKPSPRQSGTGRPHT